MEKILVSCKKLGGGILWIHQRSKKTWVFKCGNHGYTKTYNVNPACPPECGTVESMKQRVFAYEKALILQTIQNKDMDYKMAKLAHNKLTEQLASKIMESGNTDLLIMSAGPYRHYSCLSAYCVDAQEMADAVGMTCWGTDDKIRYFSQILFHGNL